MEPMTVDEILQWHAEQMRIAHEQEARERIPPLGHERGAKTKALWNGKAYEIVPIVEPLVDAVIDCAWNAVRATWSRDALCQEEPDPAQQALDEFIAVRKAKREAPEPVGRSPISDWKQWETECALARAMARTNPLGGK